MPKSKKRSIFYNPISIFYTILFILLVGFICSVAYFQDPRAANYDELLIELQNAQKGDMIVFKSGTIAVVDGYLPSRRMALQFISTGKSYTEVDALVNKIREFGVINQTEDPEMYFKLTKLFIKEEKYLD